MPNRKIHITTAVINENLVHYLCFGDISKPHLDRREGASEYYFKYGLIDNLGETFKKGLNRVHHTCPSS